MLSPMSFFDATPIGRLINLFSKDVDDVDTQLPSNLNYLVKTCFQVIFTIVTIIAICPSLLAALVVLVAVFIIIML